MSAVYFTVYIHVVPNGKVYVGQTAKVCLLDRWGFNGEGYKNNKPFYDDIQLYGWDNIAHVVICDMLTSEQADYLDTKQHGGIAVTTVIPVESFRAAILDSGIVKPPRQRNCLRNILMPSPFSKGDFNLSMIVLEVIL